MIRCKRINPFEYLIFREMVLPCFRNRVARRMQEGTATLEGAYVNGRPAGLAVLIHPALGAAGSCRVHTLHVTEGCRGRGIGSLLLGRAVENAAGMGAGTVYLDFSRRNDWAPAMDKLASKTGFETADEFIVHHVSFSPAGLCAHLRYLDGLTAEGTGQKVIRACPITGLSKEECRHIRKGEGIWYPRGLNPFLGEGQVNSSLSLALKKEEEVAGWVDVRDLDYRTIMFNTVFIKDDYRGRGWFTSLLKQSLERLKAFPEINRAVYKTKPENQVLLSVMDKLLGRFYQVSVYGHTYKVCHLPSRKTQKEKREGS